MNAKSLQEAKDEDLRNAIPALQRAAQRARQIAAQTQTAIIVMRDGQMVREQIAFTDQLFSADDADDADRKLC
ncbi:hypothetical protein [Candidatus Contendibacter odensensis]|jgi:hypothetical protein|uniref:Uncharacterized protein n=1 Tax=Candidatus Contendobacter odensis Run_B_J11 TaxID=1400861 RepID=A0A7U7GD41_9GAMM|nr:hypothetical protein [Candidatus Contendobacter odensis]CDH46082.1 hypothetical protein BN874_340042 [Candidatus Contendobacter odensis Run_B_J11]